MGIKGWLTNESRGEGAKTREAIGRYFYIELPSLDVLARFLASDHDDELGDFTPGHPLVELRHDFLDVRFDLVVGCN